MAGLTPQQLQAIYGELLRAEDFQRFDRERRQSPWGEVDCWVWPGVVTASEWEHLRAHFEKLTPPVLKLGLDILKRGEADSWLPREPYLLQALRDDSGSHSPQVVWRYDFVWQRDTGRVEVMEVQAGDPSGMGWVDARARDYPKLAAWRALQGRFPLNYLFLSGALVGAFRQLSGRPSPRVLFLAAPESTVKGDIEELASECSRQGVSTKVLAPSQLSEELLLAFDVVYRDTYEELYFPPHEAQSALLAECASQGRIVVVNPLRSNLWDSKALLSKVEGVLPTRRVSDCCFEELAADQHRWVLKPSFHYGGFGIVLGPECSAERWCCALQTAFEAPRDWVVQRYTRPGVERFPFLQGATVQWEERFATWSAWVVQGKVAGLYLRVSRQTITNVHQGGALLPVFCLGETEPDSLPR